MPNQIQQNNLFLTLEELKKKLKTVTDNSLMAIFVRINYIFSKKNFVGLDMPKKEKSLYLKTKF